MIADYLARKSLKKISFYFKRVDDRVLGMIGLIGIERLSVMAVIGVLPHERGRLQEIFIDLKVRVNLETAASSDMLSDTLSYADLAEACQRIARETSFYLVESFAKTLLETIKTSFPVSWVWIKISKPSAIEHATSAYIEIEA